MLVVFVVFAELVVFAVCVVLVVLVLVVPVVLVVLVVVLVVVVLVVATKEPVGASSSVQPSSASPLDSYLASTVIEAALGSALAFQHLVSYTLAVGVSILSFGVAVLGGL